MDTPRKSDGPGGEDEKGVEENVQRAEENIQETGGLHIPAALENGAGHLAQLGKGEAKRIEKEIGGGIGGHILRAPEPAGERAAQSCPQGAEEETEKNRGQEPLTGDASGFLIPLCAHQMGHLDGIARGHGDTQAVHEPGGGDHKADGGGGVLPQGANHGRVDILHHDGADLRQNGGDTQGDDHFHQCPSGGGAGAIQFCNKASGHGAPPFG